MNNSKINLKYYDGSDKYSDGGIEEEILTIVTSHSDYSEILLEDNRWEILYHLSPIRRNLLEWMDFSQYNTALEVGGGCGAITGLLCENVSKVTSVELSLRRAKIIDARHSAFNNLDVIVGDVLEIPFQPNSFDLITLIGVLEYSGAFSKEADPYNKILSHLYNLLSPGGTLLVAIENKFGLKYWAGAREDHTSIFFDGLENYPNNSDVRTFSKKELTELLEMNGFEISQFLYPYPDYKIPQQIYSDDYLPSDGFFSNMNDLFDNEGIQLFNENQVMDNLLLNRQFPFFANSYLVVCKKV